VRSIHSVIAIALALLAIAVCGASAQTSDLVTVTVNSVAMIEVPGSTGLTMSYAGPGGDYSHATRTDIDGFQFSHNAGAGTNVTAKATQLSGGANDITLTLKIGDNGSPITLVEGGAVLEAPGAALAAVAAGNYSEDLHWGADGSLSGTPQGSYAWTVAFTVGS
jgi:hypothetical protein